VQAQSLSLPLEDDVEDDAAVPTYTAILARNEGRNAAADFATSNKPTVYNDFDVNPTRVLSTIDLERLGNIVQTVPLHKLVDMELLPSDCNILEEEAQAHREWLKTQGIHFGGAARDASYMCQSPPATGVAQGFKDGSAAPTCPSSTDHVTLAQDASSSLPPKAAVNPPNTDQDGFLDQLLAGSEPTVSPQPLTSTSRITASDDMEDALDALLGGDDGTSLSVETTTTTVTEPSVVAASVVDDEDHGDDLDFLDSMM
jgi:hypothetical protein